MSNESSVNWLTDAYAYADDELRPYIIEAYGYLEDWDEQIVKDTADLVNEHSSREESLYKESRYDLLSGRIEINSYHGIVSPMFHDHDFNLFQYLSLLILFEANKGNKYLAIKLSGLFYKLKDIELEFYKNRLDSVIDEDKNKWFREHLHSVEQSKRGQNRKGTKGYVRHAIEKICKEIGSNSYENFMEALSDKFESMEDSELIEDLYESSKDHIYIHKFTIDTSDIKTAKQLIFQNRQGIEDKRAIKTIKNYLSEINPKTLIS